MVVNSQLVYLPLVVILSPIMFIWKVTFFQLRWLRRLRTIDHYKHSITKLQYNTQCSPSCSVRTNIGSEKFPKPATVDPATWMTYSLYFPNPCSSAWSLMLFTVSMDRVPFALSCLQYLTWYSKTIPLLWSKGISCQLTLTLVELVLYAVTFDGGWSGAEDIKVKIDEYANQLCMEVISI